MEKKLTKNEKGITLVALIITIIILLILAVVSIRAITGDNILGKAEAGKEKYERAKKNETDILKKYESKMRAGGIEIEEVLNKAYGIYGAKDFIPIYSIKSTDKGDEVYAVWFNTKGELNELEKATISDISYDFEPIKVYDAANNGQEIKIDSNKFLKLTITEINNSFTGKKSETYYYISNEYFITDAVDGAICNNLYGEPMAYTRNSEYDQYIQ